MCACHSKCVDVRRQHAEVGSFRLMCGSQEQNWAVRLGSRHLHPLALLTGLACWFKWSIFCPRVGSWIIHNVFSQFFVSFCICEIEFARSWNLRSVRLFSFYKKQRSFTRQEGSVQLLPGIWALMSSGVRQASPSHVYEVLFHRVWTRDGEALNHLCFGDLRTATAVRRRNDPRANTSAEAAGESARGTAGTKVSCHVAFRENSGAF